MAESLFILELEFLHIQGGCSLIVVSFVLMLMVACCFILSASLCAVANHMANWTHYYSYHMYPHLAINFSSPFSCYPMFHILMSVGRK